jgi:hypothetical protein
MYEDIRDVLNRRARAVVTTAKGYSFSGTRLLKAIRIGITAIKGNSINSIVLF